MVEADKLITNVISVDDLRVLEKKLEDSIINVQRLIRRLVSSDFIESSSLIIKFDKISNDLIEIKKDCIIHNKTFGDLKQFINRSNQLCHYIMNLSDVWDDAISDDAIWNEVDLINSLIISILGNEKELQNPSDSYGNSIQRVEEEKNKLVEEVALLKKDIETKTEKEKATLKEKEAEIKKNIELINEYKLKEEKSLEQEGLLNVWSFKIQNSFYELHDSITPIKHESSVLLGLFYFYAGSIILILIALGCYTFDTSRYLELTKDSLWIHYVAAMMPIPLLIGLLWGFVVQLNRVQRQKLIVAKHIHSIAYIEKLLLTINDLSKDSEDSLKRVNSCIDKLLENCLHNNKQGEYSEESLIKEEAKDVMPLESVLKILEKAKSLVSK